MSLIKKELTEKNGYVIEFSIDKETYAKAELEAYKKNVKNTCSFSELRRYPAADRQELRSEWSTG